MSYAQKVEVKQTAGRDRLSDIAPEFARLNDDILFGEVWNRNDLLSLRDRSLVTITALMAQGITGEPIRHHLITAKQNGITKEEIGEIVAHAAFYMGWPKAWGVLNVAKEIWTEGPDDTDKLMTKDVYAQSIMFPIGEPNKAYAQYFVGQSYLAPIQRDGLRISNVTFEPGCRNNWHVHEATEGGGQMLICVGGRGYYQIEGEEPVEMLPGQSVYIPAGKKHWHGASPNSWFSHLAFEVPGKEGKNLWLEPVSAEEYQKLP